MSDRKKNEEDRKRSGTSDDIMGISRGGGREQYGGSFGGGQSGGGAYANPHSRGDGGEGGNRFGGRRGDAGITGGQSGQGYYGGGQMGGRNLDEGDSHNAASTAGSPGDGDRTYVDHPSQHGASDPEDAARFDARNGPTRKYDAGTKGEHDGPPAPSDPDRR